MDFDLLADKTAGYPGTTSQQSNLECDLHVTTHPVTEARQAVKVKTNVDCDSYMATCHLIACVTRS